MKGVAGTRPEPRLRRRTEARRGAGWKSGWSAARQAPLHLPSSIFHAPPGPRRTRRKSALRRVQDRRQALGVAAGADDRHREPTRLEEPLRDALDVAGCHLLD